MVLQLVKNARNGSDKAALAVLAISGAYEPAKSGNIDQSRTINVQVIERFVHTNKPGEDGKAVVIPAEVAEKDTTRDVT